MPATHKQHSESFRWDNFSSPGVPGGAAWHISTAQQLSKAERSTREVQRQIQTATALHTVKTLNATQCYLKEAEAVDSITVERLRHRGGTAVAGACRARVTPATSSAAKKLAKLKEVHLPCISPYLPCISLHLPCVSPVSPPYLPCISMAS